MPGRKTGLTSRDYIQIVVNVIMILGIFLGFKASATSHIGNEVIHLDQEQVFTVKASAEYLAKAPAERLVKMETKLIAIEKSQTVNGKKLDAILLKMKERG